MIQGSQQLSIPKVYVRGPDPAKKPQSRQPKRAEHERPRNKQNSKSVSPVNRKLNDSSSSNMPQKPRILKRDEPIPAAAFDLKNANSLKAKNDSSKPAKHRNTNSGNNRKPASPVSNGPTKTHNNQQQSSTSISTSRPRKHKDSSFRDAELQQSRPVQDSALSGVAQARSASLSHNSRPYGSSQVEPFSTPLRAQNPKSSMQSSNNSSYPVNVARTDNNQAHRKINPLAHAIASSLNINHLQAAAHPQSMNLNQSRVHYAGAIFNNSSPDASSLPPPMFSAANSINPNPTSSINSNNTPARNLSSIFQTLSVLNSQLNNKANANPSSNSSSNANIHFNDSAIVTMSNQIKLSHDIFSSSANSHPLAKTQYVYS